jgi:hypothetical protein
MKAHIRGGIAPLILNHVARWRSMLNFKHTDYTRAIFTSGMSDLFMVHTNVTSCMLKKKYGFPCTGSHTTHTSSTALFAGFKH